MRRSCALAILVGLLVCFVGFASPGVAQAKPRAFYGINSDGTLWLQDGTYSTARTTDNGNVDDADAYITVGQNTGFTIWRGCLFFDTSILPDTASISSATLSLYAKTEPVSDFTLTVISEPLVGAPMETSDYGVLFDETTSIGSLSTASLSTTAYADITLNSTGLAYINKTGYTIIGLRSQNDIDGTSPTGSEYAEIWAQERGYGYEPKLTVGYDEPSIEELGVPPSMGITRVEIYHDYIETGDQLYIFLAEVSYKDEPTEDSESWYALQLIEGTDVEAQYRLPAWGNKPAHLYLSAEEALPWGESYLIKTIGDNPLFLAAPTASYTVQSEDWKGNDMQRLDIWVRFAALYLGMEHEDDIGYYTDEIAGELKLNEAGGAMFLTGIPSLQEVRPDLFLTAEQTLDWVDTATHDSTFEDGMSDNWGTTVTGYLDNIGDIAGIDGRIIGGVIWAVMMVVVVAFVAIQMGNPTAGIIVSIPFLLIGNFTGMIPLVVTAAIGVVCLMLVFRQLWLKVS